MLKRGINVVGCMGMIHDLLPLPHHRSCLSQALELDNKYVKAWAKKGDIEFFMKEYHKALDSYKMVSVVCVVCTVAP